jgi:hypothetical protein
MQSERNKGKTRGKGELSNSQSEGKKGKKKKE